MINPFPKGKKGFGRGGGLNHSRPKGLEGLLCICFDMTGEPTRSGKYDLFTTLANSHYKVVAACPHTAHSLLQRALRFKKTKKMGGGALSRIGGQSSGEGAAINVSGRERRG